MKTKAVRIHGVQDLRIEEFELPDIGSDEILAEVVTDSICMSSYKLAQQGDAHKRVAEPLSQQPTIIGHEFCGRILQVGDKWRDQFQVGDKYAIQPALNYQGTLWAPGYSYPFIGGDSQYVVIPNEVMEMGCLLQYRSEAFFEGSLAEPYSCVVGALKASYHTEPGSYYHQMGIKSGGTMAMLAGVGPMGLAALDVILHAKQRPSRIVVTDIAQDRLNRAAKLLSVSEAASQGVELYYINTSQVNDQVDFLQAQNQGSGFDDVFVFAPVREVVELGSKLLARDGCLNFFAGPSKSDFSATINFYNLHYNAHHYVATTGGNTQDIVDALELMVSRQCRPQIMVTHIGGLNVVPETTLNLPQIPGGKKLIYPHKKLDLVALKDFAIRGKKEPFYADLAQIIAKTDGLWSKEAEDYLLINAPDF